MPNTVAGILVAGDHSSRPAANAVTAGTVYSCTDHPLVYQSDGASWTTWADLTGGAGGSAVTFDINRYEAGDITVSASAIGTALQAALDLTLAAVSGDTIEVGLDYRPQAVDGEIRIDFATRVSSADVTYFSSGDGTPAAGGIQGLNLRLTGVTNQTFGASASIPLVLGAGDVSGGNVTVRIYAWKGLTNNIVIDADADRPIIAWMKNYGQ